MCVRASRPHPSAVPGRRPWRGRREVGHARPLRASGAAAPPGVGTGETRGLRVPIGITGHGSVSKASPWDQTEALSTFMTQYPDLCVLFLNNALSECVTLHSSVHCTSWKRQFRLLYDHTLMPKCIGVYKQPVNVCFELSELF